LKVLITGGRGFIGSHVTKVFENAGHEVKILSNLSHPSEISDGREIIYGTIEHEYEIERAAKDVDIILHLAARINVDRGREFPRPFFDVNVEGTFNVLEVCRRLGKRMIYAATSEALGSMQPDYCNCSVFADTGQEECLGMNEHHPFFPDNSYGATKAAAEMLCLGWHKSYGLDVTILRSFNVTGIGQAFDPEGAFIPKCIERIINDQNPVIFGSGEQTRDITWAEDLARAYLLLAEGSYPGQTFCVGTGVEWSITSIAQELIKISGKNLMIEYVTGRTSEVKRLKCDYSKIAKLGWKPTKDLPTILKEMWEYRLLKEFND
jgi:nucleoside-diphosphate-sugar epimerase